MEWKMAIKFVLTFAAVLVMTGGIGVAQEQRRGWDPPLETRAVLTVRDSIGRHGGASVSIVLSDREYESLVVTPGFRGDGDLCVSSVSSGFDRSALERAAVGWQVEGRLVELRAGEATIDLRWTRRINRRDIVAAGPVTWEKRLVMREGDRRILDLVRTTRQPSPECDTFGLTYEIEFRGPDQLADAAIAYDLWLVQQDADGELVTDRYQVTAKQGQQVDYFFRPVPYTADGRRSAADAAAILMDVAGTLSGRVRRDGNIDLTVDGSRAFTNVPATAAVSSSGRTMLTVRPGETIEVDTDLPLARQLSNVGDLNQVFGNHRTAVRITAKRLW
jgi:hypothetical protein